MTPALGAWSLSHWTTREVPPQLSSWPFSHNRFCICLNYCLGASLVAQRIKGLPAMQETRVRSLGWEDPLEKEMATHSSTLAWRIPWTEEPGGLQSMGWQELDMTERLHFHFHLNYSLGFPGGTSGKESACQCRRRKRSGFDPCVGKIFQKRAWQPTPVFLPGESPWTEEPGGLQSVELHSRTRLKRLSMRARKLLSVVTLSFSCFFVVFPSR